MVHHCFQMYNTVLWSGNSGHPKGSIYSDFIFSVMQQLVTDDTDPTANDFRDGNDPLSYRSDLRRRPGDSPSRMRPLITADDGASVTGATLALSGV